MTDIDNTGIERELRRLLGKAARHGIHRSKSTRRGLLLDGLAPGFHLALTSIEQIVEGLSPVDISPFVNKLYVSRLRTIDLDTRALFKLRITLRLGLSAAKHLAFEERYLALARTYRKSAELGDSTNLGEKQFRDRASDLYRNELEALLYDFTAIVMDNLSNEDLSEKKDDMLPTSAVDGYIISLLDDHYVFPGGREDKVLAIRNRVIKAQTAGIKNFRQQYTLFTNSGASPLPRILGVGEMQVSNVRRQRQNKLQGFVYDLTFSFPALAKGESRTIQWIVEWAAAPGDIGEEGNVHAITVTPASLIQDQRISIQFNPRLEPTALWRVDGALPADVRQESVKSRDIHLSESATVQTWSSPSLGRSHGITWRW